MDYIADIVDEILDCEGDVVIAGVTFSRSYILKELDPTAYREVCLNIINTRLEDLQYDLESLDPELDADEVELIKAQIEDLENY